MTRPVGAGAAICLCGHEQVVHYSHCCALVSECGCLGFDAVPAPVRRSTRSGIPATSEAEFTSAVIGSERHPGLARILGYSLRYHTHDSRRSAEGFPDWVLARACPRPRLVYLELKSSAGQPTAEQQEWIETLMAIGTEARCYWPDQFDDLAAWLQ